MDLNKIKNIHCVGIGGIGVSALAHIFLFLGKNVTGSDLVQTIITKNLQLDGAKLSIGKHSENNVPDDIDLVIYSNAVKSSNPELLRAKNKKIPIFSYPEMLGDLLRLHVPIVISGTHGKSTTTAMVASIFIKAGLDPWVVMGTMLNYADMHGNSHVGLGKYMIVEGDEYKAAFLHYNPDALIINNIESDHLDFYKTYDNIFNAFKKLIGKIPNHGVIVAGADDPNVRKIVKSSRCKVITFGLNYGDYQATHIVQHGEITRFAVKGLENFDLAIRTPGLHNVKNALAAAVISLYYGINLETIKKALLEFPGVWRRFEIKGEVKGNIIIDDYAHHPTEIKATLSTARAVYPGKKVICIFQPHSLDRTTYLFNEFASSFSDSDQVILTDIYEVAGRDNKQMRSIEELGKAVRDTGKSVKVLKTYKSIISYIKTVNTNSVILTVGAGTITELSDLLLKKLK